MRAQEEGRGRREETDPVAHIVKDMTVSTGEVEEIHERNEVDLVNEGVKAKGESYDL